MKYGVWLFSLASLAAMALGPAHAQSLRLPHTGVGGGVPTGASPGISKPAAQATTQLAADFIVAVVDQEPITNNDVRVEAQRLAQLIAQRSGGTPPSASDIADEALDRLIRKKAVMHFATESGIRVTDMEVEQAVESVALQNKIDVAELHKRLAADGISPSQVRKQLREQITLNRIREREVDSKVVITDSEVDKFIQSQKNSADPTDFELNLAQVLIAVPENATPAQLKTLEAKALGVLQRARAGEDFAALAKAESDGPEKIRGGEFGLRSATRYPQVFLDATRNLKSGGIADLLRSGAGFHILKVIEKRAAGLPDATLVQSRASHILLRTGPQLAEGAAIAKLEDFRNRIVAGKADFATLARENSQDGSAAQGGDLGWANAGQFVPEFEAAMNALAPGQISPPVVSRFGVHLIALVARRTVKASPREQRDAVRATMRESRLEEANAVWEKEIRARAYVELREPPRL